MATTGRLSEEKSRTVGIATKSVGDDGTVIESTFSSEIKGYGRFPDCTNLGSGRLLQTPKGISLGKYNGIVSAGKGEIATWRVNVRTKAEAEKTKGIVVMRFDTNSKLTLMNNLIASIIMEIQNIGDE